MAEENKDKKFQFLIIDDDDSKEFKIEDKENNIKEEKKKENSKDEGLFESFFNEIREGLDEYNQSKIMEEEKKKKEKEKEGAFGFEVVDKKDWEDLSS